MLHGNNRSPCRDVAKRNLQGDVDYATYIGGWALLRFQPAHASPSMGPNELRHRAGWWRLFEQSSGGLCLKNR